MSNLPYKEIVELIEELEFLQEQPFEATCCNSNFPIKSLRDSLKLTVPILKKVAQDIVERNAKVIYATWSDQPGYVPWAEGGNSLMQDQARQQARIRAVWSDLETD